MTTNGDNGTRIVLSWLREDAHENAERVLLRALDEVDTTPQRRSWWPAWRDVRMNKFALAAASAATLLLVAVVGYTLLPGLGIVGPRPTLPPITAPPVTPAGNGIIAVAKDGDIFVADRPGGDLRPLVVGPEDDDSPMFSPDGTRLAFLRHVEAGSLMMLADADGTNVVELAPALDASHWSFAPDGRSIMAVALMNGEKRIVVRPVDPAAALTVLDIQIRDGSMELSQWGGPRFRPTNAQEVLFVAQLVADGPRGIYVYDLVTGGIRTVIEPAGDQYVFDVEWLPDGQHITYDMTPGSGPRVVAPDGSGDQAFDVLRGRFEGSPFSNDGTRIVAERGGEGAQTGRPVIVPINGDGQPVVLACGPGTDIECPTPPADWIWSPDDAVLIAIVYDDPSSSGEGPLTETFLLVDARTGQVTKLDWHDVGAPAWQRVAP